MEIQLVIRNRDLIGGRNQLRGDISELLPAHPDPRSYDIFGLDEAEHEDLENFLAEFPANERGLAKLDKLADRALDSVDRWIKRNSVRVQVDEADKLEHVLASFIPRHSKLPEQYGYVAVNWSSGETLDNARTLRELGIEPVDILAVFRGDHVDYRLLPAPRSLRLLAPMLLGLTPDEEADEWINGLLLYSDEDVEVARYVREHFLSLNRSSGPNLRIYVTERGGGSLSLRKYWRWRSQLSPAEYRRYSLLQWLSVKPYDRSECYDLCSQLGIPFTRLPCLILAAGGQPEVLTFTVPDFPNKDFFRALFSEISDIIQRNLRESGQLDKGRAQAEIRRAYQEILARISRTGPIDSSGNKFIFNGYTVFINRPEGDVRFE